MARALNLALIVLATSLVGGGVGLVLAQEAPHPQPSATPSAPVKAAPAATGAKAATNRDYSIGTVTPQDIAGAEAQADPDSADNVTAAKGPDPVKRPRYGSAVLQAVDKVTAQTLRFEAKVGQPVRFKGLVITVSACETTAPSEDAPDSIAHLTALSQPEGLTTAAAREVYRGWMYANAPAVHPFSHPVYDLWLIACKATAPAAPGGNP